MQQSLQASHQDVVVNPELSATEADLAFLQEFLGEHLEVDEPSFATDHLMDPLPTDLGCVKHTDWGPYCVTARSVTLVHALSRCGFLNLVQQSGWVATNPMGQGPSNGTSLSRTLPRSAAGAPLAAAISLSARGVAAAVCCHRAAQRICNSGMCLLRQGYGPSWLKLPISASHVA